MKTQELIKQAEELLKVHDTAFTNERDMVIIATFARNHMQEIIDRLKRYEETTILLKRVFCWCEVAIGNPMYTEHTHGCTICKAVEEE